MIFDSSTLNIGSTPTIEIEPVNLPEFEPLIKVLLNWTKYILNSFECKYINGFTEECNNKIEVLKRIAFGYRSFENLRQRILLTQNANFPTPRGA